MSPTLSTHSSRPNAALCRRQAFALLRCARTCKLLLRIPKSRASGGWSQSISICQADAGKQSLHHPSSCIAMMDCLLVIRRRAGRNLNTHFTRLMTAKDLWQGGQSAYQQVAQSGIIAFLRKSHVLESLDQLEKLVGGQAKGAACHRQD